MKRIISVVLAVVTLASLLAVAVGARGYTLSIPDTFSPHELTAYGLPTMNVFFAETAPTIDADISVGEYPGPNNGCCASADTLREGMWMATHGDGNTGSFTGRDDWSSLVDPADVPEYMNTYLAYDDDFLYFACTMCTVPQTKENLLFDTRLNFMQSENLNECYSRAWTRYAFSKSTLNKATKSTGVSIYTPDLSSTTTARVLRLLTDKGTYQDTNLESYYSPEGVHWNGTEYGKEENFMVKITVLQNGKWAYTFEGRQPLGDIMRICDVEYEDGTPLDYVPEWGAFGWTVRLNATKETTDVEVDRRIFATTIMPGAGQGYSANRGGSVISGVQFSNTLSDAAKTKFGNAQDVVYQPVHFLGIYDESIDYSKVYETPSITVVKTTTRVTRQKPHVLTSAVRGINGRVVAVATSAAERTGDNMSTILIACSILAVCAAGVVVAVLMKRRSSRNS